MPYDWLHVTPIDIEEPNESLQVTLAKRKVTNPKAIKVPYFHFHPIFVPKPIPTVEKPKSVDCKFRYASWPTPIPIALVGLTSVPVEFRRDFENHVFGHRAKKNF